MRYGPNELRFIVPAPFPAAASALSTHILVVVLVELGQQLVRRAGKQRGDVVVDRVLVLVEPPGRLVLDLVSRALAQDTEWPRR